MRRIFTLTVFFLITLGASAQSPQGITFQAVARDLRGNAAPLRDVYIKDKIISTTPSGPLVWEESHRTTTNGEGVFTITVGKGTRLSGSAANFSDINWGGSTYFFNLSIAVAPTLPNPSWDPNINYIDAGVTQFWSVPYAFYANRSGSSTFLADITNPLSSIGQNGDMYLNTTTYQLFGPKTNAGWGSGTSLIGPTGPAGPQGPIGLTGPAGATGPQGPAGSQGPIGLTGPQGAAGIDGKTVLSGTGNPVAATGSNGDFYINTTTNTLFGPKASGAWSTGVSLVGPQGATGPSGPQGIQGVAGAQGATGPAGPQGPIGLTGPQGATGSQGLAGADGKTVLNGTGNPLTATGSNGDFYINTSTNTLFGPKSNGSWPTGISLVGPQGLQGVQGAIGATGAQGPQGLAGANGAQGPAGPTGATGPQGPIGLTGPAGPQGLTGATGAQGPIGLTGPQGAAGIDGKTVLSGTGNPVAAIGSNGDFYINTTTNTLFGPKASGIWPTGVSLVGPIGPQGVQGATGPAGTPMPTYAVGQFAHGGIVFWVDQTGYHGLVCTKIDLPRATNTNGTRWFGGTYSNTMAYGDGVNAGDRNTSIIISSQSFGDGGTYCARQCNELVVDEGGISYGGWYLPSKTELQLIYQNRSVIDQTALANGGQAFITGNWYYATSTEFNSSEAWAVNFSSGVAHRRDKFIPTLVRAVRSF